MLKFIRVYRTGERFGLPTFRAIFDVAMHAKRTGVEFKRQRRETLGTRLREGFEFCIPL